MSQAPAPAPAAALEPETPQNDPDEKRYSSNDLRRMSQQLYSDFSTKMKAELRRDSLASESVDSLDMRLKILEVKEIEKTPVSPRQDSIENEEQKASRLETDKQG